MSSVFVTMSGSNNNRVRNRGGAAGSRGRGQGRYQPPRQQDHARCRRGGRTLAGEQNLTMSGRQQMEFMPSVSRSSGLDKDGDSWVLLNFWIWMLFM